MIYYQKNTPTQRQIASTSEIAVVNSDIISFWLGGNFYFYEKGEKITDQTAIKIIRNNHSLYKQVTIKTQ